MIARPRSSVLLAWAACSLASATLAAAAGAQGAAPSPATAAKAPRLRDSVPAKTLVYAEVADFPATCERFKATPLSRILAEEEFQQFLAPVWQALEGELKELLLPEDPKRTGLARLPLRRAEIAVIPGAAGRAPYVAALAEGQELVDALRALAARRKLATVAAGGVDLVRLARDARSPSLAFVGSSALLVWAPDDPSQGVASALAGMLQAGPAAESLAKDEEFVKSLAKVGSSADVVGFVRVAAAVEELATRASGGRRSRGPATKPAGGGGTSADAAADGDPLEAARQLGAFDVSSIAFAESFVAGGVDHGLFARLRDSRGIVRAFLGTGKPVDRALLDKAPDGVDAFAVRTVHPRALYDAIVAASAAAAPQGIDPLRELREFEKKHGISFADDVFGVLGPEAYRYSFPAKAGSPIPIGDQFFVARLRDRARFEKCVDALVDAANEQKLVRLEVSRGKATVYTLKLDEGASATPGVNAVLFSAVSPSFAILDDWVILSSSSVGLKNEIRKLSKPRDASAEVKRALAKAPAGAAALSYFDPKPLLRASYDALASLAQLAPAASEDLLVDFQLLPTSQSITKHLRTSTTHELPDAEGILVQQSGSFGTETIATLAVLGATIASPKGRMARDAGPPAAAGPAAGPVGDAAKADVTRAALRKVDIALRVFHAETGKYPKNLAQLVQPSDDHPQGYLAAGDAALVDGWDSPFHYETAAEGGSFQLRSLGPNRRDDGGKADDIPAATGR